MMAIRRGMWFGLLILAVAWNGVYCDMEEDNGDDIHEDESHHNLNPDGNPLCNGVEFQPCHDMMVNLTLCNRPSPWTKCAEIAYNNIKSYSCNDHQRRQAFRLVKIYKHTDRMLCDDDDNKDSDSDLTDFPIFAGVKDADKCWKVIHEYVTGNLFGYGTLPCLISSRIGNATIDAITNHCNPKEAKTYYERILKIAECENSTVQIVSNGFVFALMSIVVLLAGR